ncbi:MAG: hypothetical protein NC078_03360 [Ruminococcus sp.]|nr:hypothetical protein [Ruminococcus sp.]
MININILVSILEDHRLTDEQSEELQKVIYSLYDGRIRETGQNPHIFYLCGKEACDPCSTNCKHTADITHARNFEMIKLYEGTPNEINSFWEKER